MLCICAVSEFQCIFPKKIDAMTLKQELLHGSIYKAFQSNPPSSSLNITFTQLNEGTYYFRQWLMNLCWHFDVYRECAIWSFISLVTFQTSLVWRESFRILNLTRWSVKKVFRVISLLFKHSKLLRQFVFMKCFFNLFILSSQIK